MLDHGVAHRMVLHRVVVHASQRSGGKVIETRSGRSLFDALGDTAERVLWVHRWGATGPHHVERMSLGLDDLGRAVDQSGFAPNEIDRQREPACVLATVSSSIGQAWVYAYGCTSSAQVRAVQTGVAQVRVAQVGVAEVGVVRARVAQVDVVQATIV
jgi:hypothetical protein